jgi:hypothetical protein
MPQIKQNHRDQNWHKLQSSKEPFTTKQLPHNPLSRFRQPETSSQVHKQRCNPKRRKETLSAMFPDARSGFKKETSGKDEEDSEDKNLNGETGREDVISSVRVLVVTLCTSNQRRASDLHDGTNNIGGDENPKEQFRRDRRAFSSNPVI